MKIIKDELDYEEALKQAEVLVDLDPLKGTKESDKLELLSLLIKKYEDEYYPISQPTPVDAIKFRIEQLGLNNNDLVEYIGSKSKVSEILNHKRPLSLTMIRKLHKGLNIPAEILISDTNRKLPKEIPGIDWAKFPINEMIKNKWISFEGSLQQAKDNIEELVRPFFHEANYDLDSSIYFRKSLRSNSSMDEYALAVWHSQALIVQQNITIQKKYKNDLLHNDFLVDLRKLSTFERGPLLAQEHLLKIGVKLIVIPHLKNTYIDGASFYNKEGGPIIVLTIRYDRLDSFWFTLFHEIAHLKLHFDEEHTCFIDDLKSQQNLNDQELEADEFAESGLIDKGSWSEFISTFKDEADIIEFANSYQVSPAIIAGRIRKEKSNYKLFTKFLGQGKVKELF